MKLLANERKREREREREWGGGGTICNLFTNNNETLTRQLTDCDTHKLFKLVAHAVGVAHVVGLVT